MKRRGKKTYFRDISFFLFPSTTREFFWLFIFIWGAMDTFWPFRHFVIRWLLTLLRKRFIRVSDRDFSSRGCFGIRDKKNVLSYQVVDECGSPRRMYLYRTSKLIDTTTRLLTQLMRTVIIPKLRNLHYKEDEEKNLFFWRQWMSWGASSQVALSPHGIASAL